MDYTYDAIGELKTAVGKESGGSVKRLGEQLGYVYDQAGNLTTRTNGDNTTANFLTQSLGVNNLNQLTTGSRSGTLTVAGLTVGSPASVTVKDNANTPPVAAVVYADGTYARAGISIPNANNTFIATATDSVGTGRTATHTLTVTLPTAPSFSYNQNGDLIGDGKRVLLYNAEDQLTQVYETNKWRSDFVYDGKLRLRVRREYTWSSTWVQTNECRYIYDGNLIIQERNAQNISLVSYTRGKDLSGSFQGAGGIGGMLARTDLSTGTHAYYHADGNGNITLLQDASQRVAAKYIYDPFGNVLGASGDLAEVNTYRFSSKEAHANSGLIYYLYRFYDPNLQRWPNRDPLGEKGFAALTRRSMGESTLTELSNPFLFVLNNPIVGIDPLGLTDFDTIKKMVKDIKKAADDYKNGKCPADPCKVPSSLNAICTCVYDAGKKYDTDAMIQCICQADPDDDCERNAKKVVDKIFGK